MILLNVVAMAANLFMSFYIHKIPLSPLISTLDLVTCFVLVNGKVTNMVSAEA